MSTRGVQSNVPDDVLRARFKIVVDACAAEMHLIIAESSSASRETLAAASERFAVDLLAPGNYFDEQTNRQFKASAEDALRAISSRACGGGSVSLHTPGFAGGAGAVSPGSESASTVLTTGQPAPPLITCLGKLDLLPAGLQLVHNAGNTGHMRFGYATRHELARLLATAANGDLAVGTAGKPIAPLIQSAIDEIACNSMFSPLHTSDGPENMAVWCAPCYVECFTTPTAIVLYLL